MRDPGPADDSPELSRACRGLRVWLPLSFRTHRAEIEEVFETVTAEGRKLGGVRA